MNIAKYFPFEKWSSNLMMVELFHRSNKIMKLTPN